MKLNRFTEAQIIKILEEAEASPEPVAEIARHHSISPGPFIAGASIMAAWACLRRPASRNSSARMRA